MDYEKKYKKALERAREELGSGCYNKGTIEYIFPELKDSTDFRQRYENIKDSEWFNKTHENMSAGIENDNQPFNYECATIVNKDFSPTYDGPIEHLTDKVEHDRSGNICTLLIPTQAEIVEKINELVDEVNRMKASQK